MSLVPKVLWPSNYLAVTQNKPSKFSVYHVLFNPYWLTMIDELYLYSYANSPLRDWPPLLPKQIMSW